MKTKFTLKDVQEVSIFKEGLASVKQADKYGFINKTGKIVIHCQYDDVLFFSEGLCAVSITKQMNDSTYYRCAYETKMTFYSAFDTLELNSLSRKSCEITAFFNINKKEIDWMLNNHVYFIKIKNMNTKYELLLENLQPRFFANTLLRYNKIKD
jgi:hypothetical protein